MKPFVLAPYLDQDRLEQTRFEMYMRLLGNKAEAALFLGKENYTEEEVLERLNSTLAEQAALPFYINDFYQVAVRDLSVAGWPDMVHLSIRRLDREVIRDWRELQEIKNLLVGPENTGLEVFPPESRLVDAANQYHLWVFKDAGVTLPFGFDQRLVTDDCIPTAKQRQRL